MSDTIGAEALVSRLEGWAKADGQRDAVSRSYKFGDFKTAWAFMSAVALKAEQMDHHPEWSNVYNNVHVVLTTHDAGGVTAKDVELAEYMDAVAARLAG